jgi:hypothetical protein
MDNSIGSSVSSNTSLLDTADVEENVLFFSSACQKLVIYPLLTL